jgi:ribonuclease Z
LHQAFEITILGTSSASPTKTRHPSAQFVRMEGDYFLLDCGEGTQLLLVRMGLRMHRIQYIFITHLHGDHFFGLPGLITSMSLFGRKEKLVIAGPQGLKEILEQILLAGDSRLTFEIDYIVCKTDQPHIIVSGNHFEIESVPLKHRIPCTGYILRETGPELKLNIAVCEQYQIPVSAYERIKYGEDFRMPNGQLIPNHLLTLPGTKNRSYAYISDTIYDENVASFVSGVSLLYHESTFLHALLGRAEETMHTTARQAAKIAAISGAEKLLIGHFSARYHDTQELLDEALSVFKNTEVAEEGKTYIL